MLLDGGCFLQRDVASLIAGHMPDYACLIVGANMGIVGMCKEHMGVALALKVSSLHISVYTRTLRPASSVAICVREFALHPYTPVHTCLRAAHGVQHMDTPFNGSSYVCMCVTGACVLHHHQG